MNQKQVKRLRRKMREVGARVAAERPDAAAVVPNINRALMQFAGGRARLARGA